MSAGGWAAAARIDGDVPGTGDSEGGSWVLAIGPIRAPGRLCRTPISDLDGAFAAVRYDAGAERVAVISDPFGMQALYTAERDSRTYFSTCATALARHLRAPLDPLGSALFLRAGYQFGPLTHWTGVERLGPAVSLSFDGGRPRRDVYPGSLRGREREARDNRTDDRPLRGGSPGDGAGAPIRL